MIGTIPALIRYVANHRSTESAFLDNTTAGKENFWIRLDPPEPWFTDLPEGGRAEIQKIGLIVETSTENVKLEAMSVQFEGKVFTLTSARLVSGKFEALIEESPQGVGSFNAKLLSQKA